MASPVELLLSHGLGASAQMLAALYTSSKEIEPLERLKVLLYQAGELLKTGEYRQAESLFLRAIQEKQAVKTTDPALSLAELRFSVFKCRLKLNEKRAALAILEVVRPANRTPAMNMELGRMFQLFGSKTKDEAIRAFTAVVTACPMALDALQALAELGHSAEELEAYVLEVKEPGLQVWLRSWVRGHVAAHARKYQKAVDEIAALERHHLPNSALLLGHVAEWQWRQGHLIQSLAAFERLRAAAPMSLFKLDVYAHALVGQGKEAPLNALTSAMLKIDRGRPEPWVAAARLSQLRAMLSLSDDEAPQVIKTGLSLIDKALALAPNHHEAKICRGTLYLQVGKEDSALKVFQGALVNKKTFEGYQGLVHTYLKKQHYKDSYHWADQACKEMPRNSRVLVLFGTVCRRFKDAEKKTRQLFQGALELDPYNTDAVLAMSELDSDEGHFQPAVDRLKKHLKYARADLIHTKLGEIYMKEGNFQDAVKHYTQAVNANPQYHPALVGIESASRRLDGGEDDEDGEPSISADNGSIISSDEGTPQ